jgi:hypothetical protein
VIGADVVDDEGEEYGLATWREAKSSVRVMIVGMVFGF